MSQVRYQRNLRSSMHSQGFVFRPGSDFLVEGWGWQQVRLGMRRPQIERVLGRGAFDNRQNRLQYAAMGLRIIFDQERACQIDFYKAGARLFLAQVAVGDKVERFFAEYGKPTRTAALAGTMHRTENLVAYEDERAPGYFSMWNKTVGAGVAYKGGTIHELAVRPAPGVQYYDQ